MDWARDIVMIERYDQVEIHAYQTFMPALIQELPELKQYICDIYFAGIQEDVDKGIPNSSIQLLVMEDLEPQGYRTILFNENFPEKQFLQKERTSLQTCNSPCFINQNVWSDDEEPHYRKSIPASPIG